jgi:hypothetical protein
MGKKQDLERREAERRSFEACRVIDVTDENAMRFWSERLGASEQEIAEVIRLVGPNSTAVALKLEAPQEDRVPPPITPR